MLSVVHNVTAATRLFDVVNLLAEDPRIEVVFTDPGSSAFPDGTAAFLASRGVRQVPWSTATEYVEANGIRFAYRRFGASSGVPLIFFQHFMSNLDDHDPALTDAFAGDREVVLFNNAGVASSTGATPDTIEQTARDAEVFIDAIGPDPVDLLAHPMGGLVAQQVAFDQPELVRRLVLVGTSPRGARASANFRRTPGHCSARLLCTHHSPVAEPLVERTAEGFLLPCPCRTRHPTDSLRSQPLAAAFAAFLNARTSPNDFASTTSATLRREPSSP